MGEADAEFDDINFSTRGAGVAVRAPPARGRRPLLVPVWDATSAGTAQQHGLAGGYAVNRVTPERVLGRVGHLVTLHGVAAPRKRAGAG